MVSWYISNIIFDSSTNEFHCWSGTSGLLKKYDPNDYCGASTFIVEAQLIVQTDGSVCANAASSPVSLEPGDAAIIHYKLINGTLQKINSGDTTNVGIYSELSVIAISVTILGI